MKRIGCACRKNVSTPIAALFSECLRVLLHEIFIGRSPWNILIITWVCWTEKIPCCECNQNDYKHRSN